MQIYKSSAAIKCVFIVSQVKFQSFSLYSLLVKNNAYILNVVNFDENKSRIILSYPYF